MEQLTKLYIVFIINPIAGTRSKADLPMLIKNTIDASLFNVDITFTEYAGHAEKIALECVKKGVNIIVAAGGDGTINEIGRNIVGTNTALGIIPLGSGNGLARHLNIPLNNNEAIASFNKSAITSIDYGKANGHIFFCTCGVGFDAHIGHVFAQQKTRGFWTYFNSVLREFSLYRPKKYKIITKNGKIKRRAFLITFANASQYGSNAYIAPRADIQDGLVDISILEPFPIYSVPFIGFKLFSKNINKSHFVQILRTNKVLLKRKKKDIFHFDGEPVKTGKKIEISIVRHGLKVFIPKSQNVITFY